MSEETTSKVNNTKKLLYQLIDPNLLDANGVIREDKKFQITMPEFNIYNSTVKGKPEDKFETVLYLPEGEGRKGEGGLRTKGCFKHSYNLNVKDDFWYICDIHSRLVKPAPDHIQQNLRDYLTTLPDGHNVKRLPLISVISVVLNGEQFIEETILNIINQNYHNVEYIIIDGGSTDGTLDIIKKYEHVIDYWVSERDKGIYDAMNKGIQLAFGKWLNFMNAGDTFFDSSVLANVFLNCTYEDCAVIYGNGTVVLSGFTVNKQSKNIITIKKEMPFHHPSSFVDSKILKKFKFNPCFRIAADYDLFLRLYLGGLRFCYINLYISRFLSGGISDKEFLLRIKEDLLAKKTNNICTFGDYVYSFFILVKIFLIRLIKFIFPNKLIDIYRKIKYNE